RVYHLQVLPGIADLRRNATKAGTTIVFTTGPAIPAATLSGTVLLWAEQRVLPQAVIRAAPLPDSVAYVMLADSGGNFGLSAVPPGRYRVWAIQDENNNRPPAAQRPPGVGRPPAAPSRPDTSAPKVDTARVRKLLSERPVPYDHLVVQTTQPLAPGGKYLLRVRGATNLSGVSADGQGVLV